MLRVVRVLSVVFVISFLVLASLLVYVISRNHIIINDLKNYGIISNKTALRELLNGLEAKYSHKSVPFIVLSLNAQKPEKEQLEIWRPDATNPHNIIDGCQVSSPGPLNLYQNISFYINPSHIPGEVDNFNLDINYCLGMQYLSNKSDITQNDELVFFLKNWQSTSKPMIKFNY